jgi:uncharacterized protein YciI
MYFLVLGWDATDEGAVSRRDAARASHMESITKLFEAGHVILGAGILDEDGVVRGSIVVTDYPTRAEAEAYVEEEPLKTAGVWDKVSVYPLRLPDMYVNGLAAGNLS